MSMSVGTDYSSNYIAYPAAKSVQEGTKTEKSSEKNAGNE